MSKKLEKIREKIDSLDNKIHDLLMERTALVSDVVAEKIKHNLQIVHPAREATMLRRLLARHNSVLPEAAIVRIWRELVGAVSLLQSGLKVTVSDPQGDGAYWDMARNYFGSVIPMQRVSSELVAFSAVREDDSSFAVLPWPEDTETNPWWGFLAHQDTEQPIKIVCALPYGSTEGEPYSSLSMRGLVISKIDFKDSSLDHSFILAELVPSISRGGLFDALQKVGFEPLSIHTKSGTETGAKSLHLIELAGYVEAEDQKLNDLATAFEDTQGYFKAVGGYPVPPEYKAHPQNDIESPKINAKEKIARKTGTK